TKYLEIQNNIKIEQLEYLEQKDFNNPENKKYEIAKMLMRVDQPPVSLDNTVEYYVDGHEKFSKLIEDIKKAEHHVHVSYYIFRGDKLGTAIVEALEEVAKKRSEEHTSELQSRFDLVCRLLLEQKKLIQDLIPNR